MELKTVQTHHVPVRYLEGGSGQPLVFLHGAGGTTAEDPFLAKLAESFHVYAPLIPGYGDSEEGPTIRDMLDFTLHSWDVVKALGLKDPILVGHSMGGMIAAEMAAIAPNDVSRLALICPAGLWLEDHPIADIFSTLPFEMPTRDIVKFVAFLCTLAQYASQKSGIRVQPMPESFEGPLIEADHIGLAQGRTEEEIVMALQVGAFALGVAIPNDKLEFLRALFLHSTANPKSAN